MICVAAAVVFGILALFSAKYRSLAKEAWTCVWLKTTLRPCHSGLDRRIRTGALVNLSRLSPKLGKTVYKIFPALSFLFVALTIVSFAYLAYGGVNFALYGNCNGPGSNGFCVFDPAGAGSSEVAECSEIEKSPEALSRPLVSELTNFKILGEGENTLVFIACYSCPYSKEGALELFSSIDRLQVTKLVLVDFPLEQHAGSVTAANAANCVYDRNAALYIEYATLLYTSDLSQGLPRSDLALDFDEIETCAQEMHPRVAEGMALGRTIGVYGTPTYFFNEKAYVGPLNARSVRSLVRRHSV